ncbi:hypothetical protein HMH05_25930 [Pseudomonas sp. SbB1]|uniref:Uncharacterized protein n=1 Tax=Pseudomonas putida (strain GB-1) TaxID=76869 RepID=B0KHF1_PSEPG|nr:MULTISPECIES: hypothetical protein [Pseudomonas]ABY97656.1 hypothetical protein PputGB1_1753 [Pseudomonas putida GB-1]MBP0710786.1 hypothetical protein [Pseudomonas sp. T34]MCK2190234.1 hypothetical protein [Pseudomonas sp. MB04B]MDD2087837.1 hypothetical protein [Pseudomonas putida]MDD2097810.1 hypothetical protein [Pseudomonas putida]
MKNVIAKERGFYGGKIQEPGDPFIITEEKHLGTWMEPQGWTPSASAKPVASTNTGSQGGGAPQPAFTVKHNGGGRHIVIDASGKKVGDFVGANKEEAQAEADRLIAGGDPYVKPDDTTSTNTGSQGGGAPGADGENPDDDDEGPDA